LTPSFTLPSARDLLTTLTTSTTVRSKINPTSISYTKYPTLPFKNRDTVEFSISVSDLDGIDQVQLIVGGKTLQTCSGGGSEMSTCLGSGGPYPSHSSMQILVIDSLGNRQILEGFIDVQDEEEESGPCPTGCSCMTTSMANMNWPGNFDQCSPTQCGSEPQTADPGTGSGPGTVVDGGGGGGTGTPLPDIPMFCFRESDPCPGSCSCLTPMEAAAGTVGGLSNRPCECSPTPCGTGRFCYELGCRAVKGDLTPFREEHAPWVLVHAVHQTTGAERLMPAAYPINGSTEDPKLVYSGCLSEGLWDLTPIYSETRLCEGCPLTGTWIPPSVTVDATDLCGPDITRNFHYDRPDTVEPEVFIDTVPETIYFYDHPDINITATDMGGIHRVKVYESGVDKECEPVEEKLITECCFDGDGTETCIIENNSIENLSTVVYTAVACDMAGNTHSESITKKIHVNISAGKIGKICSCRDGVNFLARFDRWDDLAAGDILPGGLDELVLANSDDSTLIVYYVNGSIAGNFSSVYTQYDRILVADVSGDAFSEIIIANNEDGNIYVYDSSGTLISNFNVDYQQDDGFDIGDVVGDDELEILVASADDDTVYMYDSSGSWITSGTLPTEFNGVRYHGDNDRHDGFKVADIVRDDKKEIIVILGSAHTLTVYGDSMNPYVMMNLERYTGYDGFTVADMIGDEKEEFIIGVDDDGAVYIYDLSGMLKVNYFPFTKYDALITGNLLAGDELEYVVAIDEDNSVYIEYGDDAPLGGGT